MHAKDYRDVARNDLQGNWPLSIIVAMIAMVLGGMLVGGSIQWNVTVPWQYSMDFSEAAKYIRFHRNFFSIPAWLSIVSLIQFLIGGAVQLGYCDFLQNLHRRNDPSIADLFSQINRFGTALLLRFLTGLFIFLWGLLFVIPGIIAYFRYAMAPFWLAEHPEASAMDALRASKELMRGRKGQLFCLELSFFGWMILCVLSYGIGYLVLNPYINSAVAAFYREVSAPKESTT